ncbi:MAG: beta-lactamase family protein [Deltaproteobacteria bacterium]|nr:beta-lactamase family protein [Deltaproteobacteria bacterium]
MMKYFKHKIFTQILLVVLVVFLGCISGDSRNDLPSGDWVEHGFSAEQRNTLRSFFDEAVQNGDIAGGSLLLMHQDEVIFREAFGYADLESGRPFTTDDVCFIASASKPVTVTTMVMLEERGILSLDDPIEKWIPAFKDVTVRGQAEPACPPLIWQALSHRSGLPGNTDLGEDKRNWRDFQGGLSEFVEGFAKAGLMAEPGTRWSYGRAGFMTAAYAAEVAAGKPFEVLMQELLLDPLGMTSTTFHPSEKVLQEIPSGYHRANDELVPRSRVLTESSLGDLINPGGGLFSTLDDMGLLLLFHMNQGVVNGKRLVSAEALARMYRIPDELPDQAYGLGLNIVVEAPLLVRHIGGSGTMVWIDFDKEMAGVLLTQTAWRGNNKFQRRFNGLMRSIFNE